jgi:hypothetical protein
LGFQKALQQVEDKLPNASTAQAAVIYGVLTDKERLQAGESTANVEIHSRVKVERMDRLAQALSRALMPKQDDQN